MSAFAKFAGERLRESRVEICELWLAQLSDIVAVAERDIFPSATLLDHVPVLLLEVAEFIVEPDDNEVVASSRMSAKARELGRLRHDQRASVHQILREYDILASILESFVSDLIAESQDAVDPIESLWVMQRIARSVRVLVQTTVETFLAEYDQTIEAQRARLRSFNQALSHQLRNPMNTLRIAAGLLEPGVNDKRGTDQERVIALVQSGVNRAQRILEDLESITDTNSDEDTPSVVMQEVDLRALVEDSLGQLRDVAESRGVDFVVAGAMPKFSTDIGKLDLVLVNLVANAIKYCDPTKPDRGVWVDASKQRDGAIELRIRDNGLGIHADILPEIFNRGFRGHSHLDSRHGVDGYGLGLALVRNCVESLGGSVKARSEPGVGSEFVVTLPAEASA